MLKVAPCNAADAARAAGRVPHELTGVPVAVKDLFVTRGQVTTAASRILQGWVPPYDATAVANLRSARLPILGKTNLDEFAMGGSIEHYAFGRTANPWDLSRIPGGSSGGSAAAVAAFEAPLALGTDTGGSIRQPAAVTGTVGVKPTYGTVSRFGVIAMASSLDTPGPMGRSARVRWRSYNCSARKACRLRSASYSSSAKGLTFPSAVSARSARRSRRSCSVRT